MHLVRNNLFMKKLILIFFVLVSYCSKAQTIPDFELIKLEKRTDYKAAEPFVIQTANYILSTPFDKKNDNRLKSVQFIGKWMFGTADYAFVLDDAASKIITGNEDLVGVYLAAMAKYALDNKTTTADAKTVKLNAINTLLAYSENKSNGLKVSKQLKKIIEAKEKGELEQLISTKA